MLMAAFFDDEPKIFEAVGYHIQGVHYKLLCPPLVGIESL
jgi:hypothetical protein